MAALSCRSNPFGNTQKSIEEFTVFTTDFTAQNDGGAKAALLDVIGGAKVSLNCAFSALTLSDVTSALIGRARAGVQVKIAFDADVKDNDTGSLTLQSSGSFLVVTSPSDTTQSQLLYGNGGTAYMRHNFCLADERYIYISTAAPDDTQMRKTPNVALKFGSPQFGIARDFLRESNMFSQLLFGNGKAKTDFTTKFTALNQVIGAYWGPQEKPLDVLGTELSETKNRVDFYSTAFQTTNSSKTDLDVPQVLARLESAKGIPLSKYFSSQALFDTSSKAYTLSNPAQYINSNVRVGANIFVIDRGLASAKTFIYTGSLRSQANSSDDSVLLELRGKYVADIVGAYLDKIGAVSVVASNTGDVSVAGAVVINELNWAGSYSNSSTTDSNDEFLELYNTTASPINISSWKFACTTDGGTTVSSFLQMPSGAVIPAGGYFTLAAKSTGAFPNATYYTGQLSVTNSSRECKLTNGKATPASSYAGQAGLTGDIIDTAGDNTNPFDNSGNIMGTNDSSTKVRRSMERKFPITAGNSLGSWQSNVNSVAQNVDIDSQFNQKTFGTPGGATSVAIPSVAFNRTLYFTTSTTHPNGVAKITGVNMAANTNAGSVQTIIINASSTSDTTGVSLTLTETGNNTGIFTSAATGTHLNFTLGASAGNTLKVSSGDTVTLAYTYSGTTYSATAQWYAQNLVINEIGSNCGGVTANDYIEILNPNAQAVSLNNMTIYRDSGSSGTACTIGASNYTSSVNLSGSISANSYILAAGSTYAASGACPAPDFAATSSVSIGDSNCVALVLSGAGPATATDDEVVDFVGYGNATNPHEGGAVATDMGGNNNQCISRNPNASDSNNNGTDFASQTTIPCSPKTQNGTLSVASALSATSTTTLTVTFNAPPNLAQAQTAGNYCIALTAAGNCSSPALTVSGAVLSGSVVTLTTSAQTALGAYTVYVSGVTLAASGGALSTNTATFTGFNAPPNVVINEIMWMGSYDNAGIADTNDEFVELQNKSGASVDISGWTISGTGVSTVTIPASQSIAANGYYVIARDNTKAFAQADYYKSTTLSISNTNFQLELRTGSSTLVDTANSTAPLAGLNDTTNKIRKSMERRTTGTNGTLASSWYSCSAVGTKVVAGYSTKTIATPGEANSAAVFNVASASPTTSTLLSVSFSEAPTAGAGATGSEATGNYSIPGLTVSGAVLSGNSVILTTTPQTAGQAYTVSVSNVTASGSGATLTGNTANFSGFELPKVKSVTPIDATTVDVNFQKNMDAATIDTLIGAFVFDNGLVASAVTLQTSAPNANKRVRITTGAQTPGTTYTLTVNNSVQDSTGYGVDVAANTGVFYGFSSIFGILDTITAGVENATGTYWSNGGVAPSASSVTFKEGSFSFIWATLLSNTTCSCSNGRTAKTVRYYPITPGQTYTGSVFLRAGTVSGSSTVRGRLCFYWFKDSTGTPSSTINTNDPASSTNFTSSSSDWSTLHTTGTGALSAPSDAYYMQLELHGCFTGTSSDQLYFDQAYFGP